MQIFKKRQPLDSQNDAALVMLSLGGDRHAFCEIVTRYQTLLCSLAYSSVGDLKFSEDIAQETFVEAWKKLETLQDPAKLKAWLCGILRFKVSHFVRKEASQPIKGASDVEGNVSHLPTSEKLEDNAISEQHQALLWQTLDQMEDTYRLPLILFYREQCSVERVAAELDISPDTAKQRLSRGRKLLQKSMQTFVEDALTKSKPGLGFAASVLLAINTLSPPAKASAMGAVGLQASSFLKVTAWLAVLASLSGLVSSFFGYRAGMDQSRTDRERQNLKRLVASFIGVAGIYIIAVFGLKHIALGNPGNTFFYSLLAHGFVVLFVVIYLLLVKNMFTVSRQLRAQERIFNPDAFARPQDKKDYQGREFKSRATLFGVPLLYFQFGTEEEGDKPAVGWIAGGSKAYGLLFAWGGLAVAPISVGIVSAGIVTVGAVGIGVIGLGTVGMGLIGFGASAIAYKAYGSLSALGWESAVSSGFSAAFEGALGHIAFAAEVNNDAAANIADLSAFLGAMNWALGTIIILVILPAAWYAREVRKRFKGAG